MIITTPDLVERARRGEWSDMDIARMYAELGDIHGLNLRARADVERKRRNNQAFADAVAGYARSMAKVFGVEPQGWTTFTEASHPEARQ